MEAVGGGAMDATASSLAQGKTRLGSGERERSGEGSSTSAARAKGEETGEGGGEARSAVAARRRRGASTSILGVRAGDGDAWRFETLPEDTRARRGLGRVADGETATPSRRETEEGDGGDGIAVNYSKFQSPVRKFSFSSSSWPQMKNS